MADPDPEEVLDLMADDCARDVLAYTSQQPLAAPELVDRCDASERTIYRRLEQLKSLGLIEERVQLDPDGHHRNVYETGLETINMTLEDGKYEIRIRIEEDTADRFAQMWSDIRG